MPVSDCATEEMAALNNEDWKNIGKKIDEAIKRATAELRPTGWANAVVQLRQIGTLANIIALFLAMMAITLGAVYQSIAHVKEEATFRTNTSRDLTEIKNQIAALRLLAASTLPAREDNQRAARELLANIKSKSVQIPEALVEQAGSNFLQASRENPGAWSVALDFASYRSSLNTVIKPSDLRQYSSSGTAIYSPSNVPGKPSTELFMSMMGYLPTHQAAVFENIGANLNKGLATAPERMFAIGGATSLDGKYIRRAVLENVEVHYSGQPVILEDVVFVNCRFVFDNGDRARQMAGAVLSQKNITFQPLA